MIIRNPRSAMPYAEGVGDVTFFQNDGRYIVVMAAIVDSVGVEGNSVVVEQDNMDEIIHIPFVRYWTVDYPL